MVPGDILVLILCKAGTYGLEVTGNAVEGQQNGEGWATAVRVMNQKGMIVLGGQSRQKLGTLVD